MGELEGDRKLSSHTYRLSITNHPTKIQRRSSSLKSAWDICKGNLFINLRTLLEGQGPLGDFSKNKNLVGIIFFPIPQSR